MTRVFVTGATGAVGAKVVDNLLSRGDEPGILIRKNSNLWRIQNLVTDLQHITGELAYPESYRDALISFKPEAVIHLAWDGVLGKNRNDLQQVNSNLPGTLGLMDEAYNAGAHFFIGVGSQAEYGALQQIISEEMPTTPTTLYGASKLAGYTLCNTYATLHGMRFAWMRLFSSYGPQDSPEWMIPYLILALLRGEKPSLTACEQKWDYLFQADAAEAIATVLHHPSASGIFNLGSGFAAPLRETVEYIRDCINPELPIGWGEIPYRPDQVMHLQANISRLNAVGWNPATSLQEGLSKTVEWYRDNRQRYNS